MTQEKLDCTACEQRLLEAEDIQAASQDGAIACHLSMCPQCAHLFVSLAEVKVHLDRYRVPEPANKLVEAVLGRARALQQKIPAQLVTIPSSAILLRVVLAGLAALPFVVLINAMLGWAVYECAIYVLPRTIAFYCMALFVAWASLTVSLSYASLPFLSLLSGRYLWRR